MKIGKNLPKKKWVSYTIATCSAVILYMILSNFSSITEGFGSLYGYIKPVVSGMIVAYIFNPLSKVFNDKVFRKMKNESAKWKLSVCCTIIVIVLAVVLLFVALIPQLADSISTFVSNVDGYVSTTQGILRDLEKNDKTGLFSGELGALASFTDKILDKIGEYFSNNVGNLHIAGSMMI